MFEPMLPRYPLSEGSVSDKRWASVKVTTVIHTLGGGGGRGGQTLAFRFSALRWRSVNTNQRPDLPTVIYQTSSSIRVKSCVLPVSSLGGLEKSYDRKVKVKERPKWRRVAPTIFLQSCRDPILFSSISCKRFQSYLTFLPCNQIAVAIQMQFWKSR